MLLVALADYPAISPVKLELELGPLKLAWAGPNAVITSDGQPIVESAVLSIFASHVADELPYFLYRVVVASDILLIEHVANGLYSIESAGSYKRLYFNPIPADISAVDTLIGTYVEPPSVVSIDLIRYEGQTDFLVGDSGERVTATQPVEIIVSKGSAQFSTLQAAISYINTLDDKKVMIKLYPGLYIENNPLHLPDYVCIRGQGSAGNTTIIGINADVVLHTGRNCCISDVALVGGTITVQHDGSDINSFAMLKNTIISMPADGVAMYISGGLGSLVVSHVSIVAQTAGTGTAIIVSGGSLIGSEIIIQAAIARGILIDNGIGTLNIFSVYYCSTAVEMLNGSILKGTLLNLLNCSRGLYFPADTMVDQPQSNAGVAYLHIDGATTDVEMVEPVALNLFGSIVDIDKIINSSGSQIGGVLIRNEANTRSVILSGNYQVDGTVHFGVRKCKVIYDGLHVGCGQAIYSFVYSGPAIGAIGYWNGSAWTALRFMRVNDFYFLDMNYVPQAVAVNGVSKLWLQLDIAATNIVVHADTTYMGLDLRYYVGRARKKNRIYLPASSGTAYFLVPDDADVSTAYTIRAASTVLGITINGNYSNSNNTSATAVFDTAETIQSVSVIGTGIRFVIIEYYAYKF